MSQIGHFVWYDLVTTDPKAAIDFYTAVTGWKTEAFAGMDYTMFVNAAGKTIGGAMLLSEEAKAMGAPPHWIGYVGVEDVDATLAKAKELGATVFVPGTDIPGVGRFAILADPQGAAIAVFSSSEPGMSEPKGPDVAGDMVWHELYTTDWEAALRFYAQLFGWRKIDAMDMGPMGLYVMYGPGDTAIGGVMNRTPDMPGPSAFMYYINVVDLDASMATAQERGAQLMVGPMDIPGGGRIAMYTDPQGAAFSLHVGPTA